MKKVLTYQHGLYLVIYTVMFNLIRHYMPYHTIHLYKYNQHLHSAIQLHNYTLKLIRGSDLKNKISAYRQKEGIKGYNVDHKVIKKYEKIIIRRINNIATWQDAKFIESKGNIWHILVCDISLDEVYNNLRECELIKQNLHNDGYCVKIVDDGVTISFRSIENMERVVRLNCCDK